MSKTKIVAAVSAFTLMIGAVPAVPFHPAQTIIASASDISDLWEGVTDSGLKYTAYGTCDTEYDEERDEYITTNVVCEYMVITGYEGSKGKITIPAKIEGYPVTYIEESAFSENTIITSVTIPDSVEAIGVSAFHGCSSLTKVQLPSGLERISEWLFSDCEKLTSVTIPSNVSSIGMYAFASTGLTSITIPDAVDSIGGGAFSKCENLKKVTMPDSVAAIGEWAFEECHNLTSFHIPSALSTMSEGMLSGCASLTEIEIPDTVKVIKDSALSNCIALTEVTIPASVQTLSDSTFWGDTKLKTLNIPDSVTTIGSIICSNCDSLSYVVIPDSVKTIGDNAFGYAFYSFSVYPEKNFDMEIKIVGHKGTAAETYANENELVFVDIEEGLKGDVTGDYDVTVADLVLLQKWLLCNPKAKLSNPNTADWNADGIINAADFSGIKNTLFPKEEEEEE